MKPVFFMGTSRDDLRDFPEDVKNVMGYALYEAQSGGKHRNAKPLKGFGSASILEIVDDFDGDTYRAVYTVKFKDAVYVLHAFQKKSKKGIQTPAGDIELIKTRLKQAQDRHSKWLKEG
jgi:phage-related protein